MGGRQHSEVQSYIDREIIKSQGRLGSVKVGKLFEIVRKIYEKQNLMKNKRENWKPKKNDIIYILERKKS